MADGSTLMVIGRCLHTPKCRYTANGTAITSFTMAWNQGFGDHQKDVFLDCTIFGKRGEAFSQYVGSKQEVWVSGELSFDKWEGRDGTKRSKVCAIIGSWGFVGESTVKKDEAETDPGDTPNELPDWASDTPF